MGDRVSSRTASRGPQSFQADVRPDSLPRPEYLPRGKHFLQLWVGTRGSQSVIYEYDNGALRSVLSYVNEPGRAYYQLGDVVLKGKWSRDRFLRLLGEPVGSDLDGSMVMDIVLGFLGMEPPEYEVGWKITGIEGVRSRPGDGIIRTVAVLFLEDAVVELDVKTNWLPSQLADSFVGHWSYVGTIKWIAKGVTDLSVGAVRGAAKPLIGFTLRQASQYTAKTTIRRRVLRALQSKTPATILKAAWAFVKAFTEKIHSLNLEAQIREKAGAKTLRYEDIPTAAVLAGVSAFIGSLLDECLPGHDPKTDKGLRVWLAKTLANEFVQMLSPGLFKAIPDAAANAYEKQIRGEGTFKDLFGQELLNYVSNIPKETIWGLLKSPGKLAEESQ